MTDYTEALMQLTSRDRDMFTMSPRNLGKQISIVKHPWAGCPYCLAAKSTMAVHEFGVQWPCGCARILPPLHGGDAARAACKKCFPLDDNNVIPLRRAS